MLKVAHRINTLKGLAEVPAEYGVEVDLRNDGKKIILNHDPFSGGALFEDFCKNYRHALLLLNIKTEGIEHEVLRIVKKFGIKNYFFLDLTFPTILKLSEEGEKNIAVRFSEYEPIENALALKGKVKWIWIDTFTKLPLTPQSYRKIKKFELKIFVVGPDRWNRFNDIEKVKGYFAKNRMNIDAVMSELSLLEKWD